MRKCRWSASVWASALHYLAQPLGSWWAMLVGLAICVAWNAMLWIVKSAKA